VAEPLWKPVAAGPLVVAAIAMVGRNLVGPGLEEDEPLPIEPAATEPAGEPPPQSTEPAAQGLSGEPAPADALPVPIADSADTSLLAEWTIDPGRDPFGSDPRGASTADAPMRRDGTGGVPAKNPAPRHKLTAIAWGAGKLALVDGIPVGIGDTLPGGRVVDIRSDRLVLRRGTTDTLLRFWEGRTP